MSQGYSWKITSVNFKQVLLLLEKRLKKKRDDIYAREKIPYGIVLVVGASELRIQSLISRQLENMLQKELMKSEDCDIESIYITRAQSADILILVISLNFWLMDWDACSWSFCEAEDGVGMV